jgi:uncharacterized protein YbjT (DUF2867 family)
MSDAGPILVAGATGKLGMKICERLAKQGRSVRALVRPTSAPERRQRLHELGIDLVEGDIERPETLGAAVSGVAKVITTASTFPADPRPDAIERVERQGTMNLVDAAAAEGTGRFVYISLYRVPYDYPHQSAKLAAEQHLIASGLEYAILQPSLFTEVWFSPPLGFDLAGGTVQVFGPGTATVSWISEEDIADYAVWALDAEQAAGQLIELGGPEAVSQLDAIAIHEELLGSTLERVHIPLEALEQQLLDAEAPTAQSIAGVMLQVARGTEAHVSEVARAAGVRATTVRDLVERKARERA